MYLLCVHAHRLIAVIISSSISQLASQTNTFRHAAQHKQQSSTTSERTETKSKDGGAIVTTTTTKGNPIAAISIAQHVQQNILNLPKNSTFSYHTHCERQRCQQQEHLAAGQIQAAR